MRTETGIVKTKDGREWEFTLVMPKDVEEAIEVYTPQGVLYLINSALRVKQQAIAREAFKQGKDREEVDAAVAAYRPGQGARTSTKAQALQLIMDNRDSLLENPDLMSEVQKAFVASKFGKVVELLS